MGYSVVTTVLAPAVSYDLTDVATVKAELSIKAADTSNDTWIARAITGLSDTVATHVDRVFPPEQVQDVFDVQQDPYPYQTPGGFSQLVLSRWAPKSLLKVISVIQTLAPGTPPTTQTLVEGTDFRVDPDTGRLLRLNPFTGVGTTWEAIPVTVIYTAGYGALVQESHPVPATGPYTVTIQQAAAFSCDHQVAYSNGTVLTRVSANPAQGQYSVAAGVYTFNAADEGQALAFAYATVAIPAGLVDIFLQVFTGRFKAKGRDPALMQQDTPNIGTQRWWIGGLPGQRGPFPPDVEGALDKYRMPIVA